MDDWKVFNAKRACKGFKIKKLGENHDLHVQSNTYC